MIRMSKLLREKIPNNEVTMDYREEEIGKSNMIIYTTEDGLSKIETIFDGDTVWLSKAQMAELFQRDRSVISKHIKNIFEEGELSREGNVQILHIANSDKPVEFYNLDVIISVDYRVKSKRGTQFRIWATGILKEYMRKGFALDDERLKNLGGGSYLYEGGCRKGIYRAYHVCRKPADFAERQAEREQVMTMKDWAKHLDRILTMSGEQLLSGNGSVTRKQAAEKATGEYKKYKECTLSDAEQDYLNSIKVLGKKADKN